MNEEAQKVLNEITQKEPAALTESDIVFLKARSKYLSRELKQKYAAELNEDVPPQQEPEEMKRSDWSDHPADQDDDDEE